MPTVKKVREEKLSEQLSRLLAAIEASGRAVSPRSKDALLQSIVDAAGHIFGAAAASILLVNEQEELWNLKSLTALPIMTWLAPGSRSTRALPATW